MNDETTLRRAAASSPEALVTLLICAMALRDGHGAFVDELAQMQPGTDAWRVQLAKLRRLVEGEN